MGPASLYRSFVEVAGEALISGLSWFATAMLGTDSVLAHLRDLAGGGRNEEQPARMSLVDNTAVAVEAHFARQPLDAPWIQVVLREQRAVVHPLTGKAVKRPPTAILKQGDRPLALLVGELLLISRTAPRCLRLPLVREARQRVMDYELVDDGQLDKLA
jgi:hypothetical protein